MNHWGWLQGGRVLADEMDGRQKGAWTKVSKFGVANSNAFQGQTGHLKEYSRRTGEATENGKDWCTHSHLDGVAAP